MQHEGGAEGGGNTDEDERAEARGTHLRLGPTGILHADFRRFQAALVQLAWRLGAHSSRTVYCTGTWRLQNTVFYWDYDDGFKPSRVHCKRLQAVTVTDAVEPARGGTVSK